MLLERLQQEVIYFPYPFPHSQRLPCFLSVTSPHRLRWDLFIMALAVWNCFYVPFALAFLTARDSTVLLVVNVLIDLAYICDIGV